MAGSRKIAIKITVESGEAVAGSEAVVKALKDVENATDRLSQRQLGLTNSFLRGNIAARAISASYIGIRDSIYSAVGASVGFEFSMAKFMAITQSSVILTNDLGKSIRTLSLETGQAQTELASAALEMAKMGLSVSQVEQILPGVSKLARGLDEDLTLTAKAVVSMLNAYGYSADHAEKLTNELAFTVKASALDITSFATAFAYVGATASVARVPIEDLQASMDVLSNSGIRASTIGTQLRRIITDLANEHSKAAKLIGGTIDTYGSLENALDAVAAKHLNAGAYAETFGRTASSVAAILVRYRGELRLLASQTEEATTATGNMTALINDTLQGKVDLLSTAWKELGIQILGSNGFLKDFLDKLREAISAMREEGEVNAFKRNDPKGFNAAAETASAGARWKWAGGFDADYNKSILGSDAYASYQAREQDKINQAKWKDNLVGELKDLLDKQQAKSLANKDLGSDLHLNVQDKANFEALSSLYTSERDRKVFDQAWSQASYQLIRQIESQSKGESLPAKQKAVHYSAEDKFNQGFVDQDIERWEDMPKFGYTPQRQSPFGTLNQDKANAAKGNAENFGTTDAELEKRTKAWDKYNKELEEYNKEVDKARLHTYAFKLVADDVNKGINKFADDFGTRLTLSFTRGSSAFRGFSDIFSEIAAQITSQLISLTIRFAIFSAIVSSLGIGSGGMLFNSAGGTGFLDSILSGLGGKIAPAKPSFSAANGGEFLTTGPTSFLAGESGRERVSITPAAKVATGGSNGAGMTVVINGDVHDYKAFERKVKRANLQNKKDYI